MEIYAKGTIGKAWQYHGDLEPMPDWVKESFDHCTEFEETGVVRYLNGGNGVVVNNGDWFVVFSDGTKRLYCDDAAKLTFTSSDPASDSEDVDLLDLVNRGLIKRGDLADILCQIEDAPNKRYQTKPHQVDAWQYPGKIELTKLPSWVSGLVLHCCLGHRFDGTFNFQNYGKWLEICTGDWLVHHEDDSFSIMSDADFKESFEEIK